MYTIECEDPNCVKCLQDSKDPSSEEDNEHKMAFEELVSNDMLLANEKRARCLVECREMKDEIQSQIGRLIAIFRERERELCIQVEKGFQTQMAIIDHDATVQCMDKILKRNSEPLKPPRRLVFKYDLQPIRTDLKNFGQLTYEEVPQRVLKQRRDAFEGFSVRLDERLSKMNNLYFYVDSGKFSRMQEMVAQIEEMTQNFDKLPFKENQKPKTNEEPLKRLDDSKTSYRLLKRPMPISAIVNFDNLNKRVEDEGRYFDDGTTSTSGEVFRLDKLSKERKRSKDDSLHYEGTASMPRIKVENNSLSDDESVKNAVKELNDEATIKLRKRHGPTLQERRRYEEARLAWYGKEDVRVSMPDLKSSEAEGQHFEEDTASVSNPKVEMGSFMDYEAMKSMIETDMEGKKRSGPKMEGRKAYEQPGIPFFYKVVKVRSVPDLVSSDFEEGAASVSSAKVEMGGGFMVPDLNKSSKDEGQHFEEGTASASSAEVGMDSLSDEDMEIISRNEAAAIPSESPSLPPKDRFRFARKRSWGPSLFFRKPLLSPENNSPSEKPIPDAKVFQESLAACFSRHKRVSAEPPSFNALGLQDPLSTRLATSNDDDSRKELRTSDALLLSQDERKEIPSGQESSSECLGDSNAEGHDPSAALLSSFKKYLEKNPEGEWLVREKSSEQSLSAGNSCIENFNQWLSTNDE